MRQRILTDAIFHMRVMHIL